MLSIRLANTLDADAIWSLLEPVIRAGETHALPRDMGRNDVLSFWLAAGHEVYVAEDNLEIVGTYFLRANQKGGGSHVANCAYVTAAHASGRGIALSMCLHSLEKARQNGFRAMQFNFVVGTNVRAIRAWKHCGFEIIGRLPEAFLHPASGYTDAFIMFRKFD